MKVCPKCGAVTGDDAQRFCLMDGTELVAGDSEPTVVIPTTGALPTTVAPAKRKKSPLIWIAVAIVFMLVAGVAIAGLVLYSYRLGTENARNDKNAVGNLSTRSSSAPAKSVPSPSPSSEVSATPEASHSPAGGDTEDEATPIEWTTSASGFKEETGKTYKFLCPPNGAEAIIWGSDVYTADSSICTAAVHAGIINIKDGGEVTIEFRPGRQLYGSTTRNGVTSANYGEYPHSFVVR